MTATEPDMDALASEPIDGAEPEIVATEVVEPPADAVPATAVERRPDVRPTHQGPHQIAGTDLAVVPPENELEAIAQMANTFAAAGVVPAALRNKPNDVFLVLMTARDLGMGLTTAMRECHVIEGKVTISPKAKLAMVRQQGLGKVWPDPANDGESATWYAERHDLPGVRHQSTFTKTMAQAAGLLPGKDKSAWRTYPERMLSWRACGYLLDDVFSEVGTGLYSPDELGAVTNADGEAVIDVVGSAGALTGMAEPRGQRRQQQPQQDQPADPQAVAELQARIAALSSLPDARTALVALWTAPRSDEDSSPKLPPIQHLLAKQVKIADAMVASIEQRAQRGEWGDWTPAGTDQPAAGAPDAAQSDPAPTHTDAGGDAETATQPPEPAGDEPPSVEQITKVVIAEVKAMEPEAVDEQLANRSLDTSGRLDTRRHRLAKAMIGERTEQRPTGAREALAREAKARAADEDHERATQGDR